MKMIDWDQIPDRKVFGKFEKKEKRQDQFLKLEANQKYKVKIASHIIEFFEVWDQGRCKIVDEKHPQGKRRYACVVIDMADGKAKVMCGPVGLFSKLAEWPLGDLAEIHVICPNGKKDMTTRYYLPDPSTESPLTPAEKANAAKIDQMKLFAVANSK